MNLQKLGWWKRSPKILRALACLGLALRRFWNVVLYESPPAELMMFGFLGALCPWLALLLNSLLSPPRNT